MPSDTHPNGRASGTTSPNKPPEQLSETEFLTREADEARDAISQTIAQMRDALGDAADVRAWTRRYPWAALGASVAAGFVVAAALMPGRRRREDREPALLERILADETISKRLKELAEEDHQQRAGSRSQFLQSVAGTLWATFGPAVQSAFTAAVAAKAAQPEDAQPENADEQQHATEEGTQSENYGSV